ncbi:hypothetical protein EG866_15890, partial [Enterococcus faecalis]
LAQRRREPHQAHHAADAGGARRLRGQQRHDGLVAEAGAERLHGHRAVHEHAAVRAGPDGHGVAREVEGRVLQVVRHGEVPVRARDQVGGLARLRAAQEPGRLVAVAVAAGRGRAAVD